MDRRTIAVFGGVTAAFVLVLGMWTYITARPFCAMAAAQTGINGTTAGPAMMDAPCTVPDAVMRTATSTTTLLIAVVGGGLLASVDRLIIRGSEEN